MTANIMKDRAEHAIQILSKTRDGNDLAPQHLSLLQLVVNGRANVDGLKAFDRIYDQVTGAGYQRPWFHDRQNLTKDHEGYVYWRGRQVEHYSFHDRAREAAAANRLADQCLQLEALGLVPGTSATPDRIISLASDPGTLAWAHAIASVPVYTLLERGGVDDGVRQAVILFWADTGADVDVPRALCGVGADTKNRVEVMVDPIWDKRQVDRNGLDLFYTFQDDGYSCVPMEHELYMDPPKFLAWAEQYGFTAGGLVGVSEAASGYITKLAGESDGSTGAAERSRG